jgi:hypothetical protein
MVSKTIIKQHSKEEQDKFLDECLDTLYSTSTPEKEENK